MAKREKNFNKKELPGAKHDKFLDEILLMIEEGFEETTDALIEDIVRQIKQEKLAKSDKETVLKLVGAGQTRGFTGIPQVSLDLSFTATLIDKYMAALKWMLMGKTGGKDIEKLVEALGMKSSLPVGAIFGTFLNAIDEQRKFYQELNGRPAPKIHEQMLKQSLDFVTERTGKWVDLSLLTYKNKMLQTLQDKIAIFNTENDGAVHSEYHSLLSQKGLIESQIKTIEDRQDLIQQATKAVLEKKMSLVQMKQSLKDVTQDYGKDWDRLVNTEIGMATGAGTHLAVKEVFGAEDDQMTVALVAIKDGRCCDHCSDLSYHPDGRFKVYTLAEIKPAGYNISKKRDHWFVTPGPIHPNCRCSLVYIPKGFIIKNDGTLERTNVK